MFELQQATSSQWLDAVMANFDDFLIDHAGAEKKASGMAMSMALHYKDKADLVAAMIDLAIEELAHFREVVKLMAESGLQLQPDEKDPYVNALNRLVRKDDRDQRCIDRLLIGAIVEARGAERFGMVADALPEGKMKNFYIAITRSEDRHTDLFLQLARQYFPNHPVDQRLQQLLVAEAEIVATLPHRAALH